jgi:hypothetical protein
MTWKDQRGASCFATVVTRNVSDYGVYVECPSAVSIPLFRLVQFQVERESDVLPDALRQGRVLSAVYRISAPTAGSGGRQGFALRLMIEPGEPAAVREDAASRATA